MIHVYTLLPCCLQEELADLSEQQVKHLYGHSGCITGLSYSTDQAVLFSSSADGTVRLWSTQWCKNLAAYRWVAAASQKLELAVRNPLSGNGWVSAGGFQGLLKPPS